jgi:hypothetical protein
MQVCGAFWTDHTLAATCSTKNYALAYARNQELFFRDYICAHLRMANIKCIANGKYTYPKQYAVCQNMFSKQNVCESCAGSDPV